MILSFRRKDSEFALPKYNRAIRHQSGRLVGLGISDWPNGIFLAWQKSPWQTRLTGAMYTYYLPEGGFRTFPPRGIIGLSAAIQSV